LAATNRDLLQEVENNRFREDLYYRINVLTIDLPRLRDRTGDLELLAHYFAGADWKIDPGVLPALKQYDWPGNVRQLQNAIDRAKILADDKRIRVENLPPEIVDGGQFNSRIGSAGDMDLFTYTRRHVLDTYRRHRGNKAQTARALRVSRRTLYRLLEKYEGGVACSR
jgi:transcriptional regulator of acetoin/glycerol metabolism